MLGRNLWWLRRSLLGLRKHTSRRRQDQASLGFCAAAAVAQSVKHPEFRSLKEVQWSRREINSRSRHMS